MRVIKKCLPLLKAGQGRIINVSSVAGLHGYPGKDRKLNSHINISFGKNVLTRFIMLSQQKCFKDIQVQMSGLYHHFFQFNLTWRIYRYRCRVTESCYHYIKIEIYRTQIQKVLLYSKTGFKDFKVYKK